VAIPRIVIAPGSNYRNKVTVVSRWDRDRLATNIADNLAKEFIMKLHRVLYAVAVFAMAATLTGEIKAEGFGGRTGLPWFGYGYSGSLYGLGRLPVPPYFAIHPPVYYSLPQARPYGQSPFAYSGDYHRPVKVVPRVMRNPHFEPIPLPAPVESTTETTTSTVRVIKNPFYTEGDGVETQLASQVE